MGLLLVQRDDDAGAVDDAWHVSGALASARDLEAQQDEALRLLQREIAELERQRDQLKRENAELGLTSESPTKRGRGRAAATAAATAGASQSLEQIMCVARFARLQHVQGASTNLSNVPRTAWLGAAATCSSRTASARLPRPSRRRRPGRSATRCSRP